jgi:hypothetical protein
MLVGTFATVSTACSPDRLDAIELSPSALTTDLMAHYRFDDGSGTVVADSSGNKRNGTLVGGTWITDGKFGGALHLDGASYVTVANFPNAPSSFTVSSWTRVSAWYDGGLETVASTEQVFEGGWEVNVENPPDGSIGLQAAYWDDALKDGGGYTYIECECLPLDAWTHVAFVVDSSEGGDSARTMTMYLDGTVANVVSAAGPISAGTAQLFIGRWSRTGRLLIGDVDDMTIYGRALAQAEVLALGQQPPSDVP